MKGFCLLLFLVGLVSGEGARAQAIEYGFYRVETESLVNSRRIGVRQDFVCVNRDVTDTSGYYAGAGDCELNHQTKTPYGDSSLIYCPRTKLEIYVKSQKFSPRDFEITIVKKSPSETTTEIIRYRWQRPC